VQWMEEQFPRSARFSATPLRSTLCVVAISVGRLLNMATESNLVA